MGSADEVRSALTGFIDDLFEHVEAQRLEDLLRGTDTLRGSDVESQPEPWVRKHLIRRLLDAAGLEWEPEIHGMGEGYPDFGIVNLEVQVIGEDKSINKIKEAEKEVKEYLNNRAASRGAEYGIATDGIEWVVYRIELGGDYLDYDVVGEIDLRSALHQIARNKNYISQTEVVEEDVDRRVDEFYDLFSLANFNRLLTSEAPKILREQKKEGIEEFYDLYVQLLFGEGERDYEYDTTLLDDIQAPSSAGEDEKRKFAIKLVNRLLFVKFLEDREVLPSSFLSERVDRFQRAQAEVDQFGGGLYKTQLEPLFFNLFNTDTEERPPRFQGTWFDDVPYLNGSLFAPEEGEREYDVNDRMLIRVVNDLVEGHELREGENGDGALDPSVLGNVFEMTINHISGESEAQKEEGAYYTPTDVIKLITRQAVDPKVEDVLVDVFSSQLEASSDELDGEQAENMVRNYGLGEILKRIENREGYFGDPSSIQEAFDQLGNLKIVDPACGSGHFLTAVLDEVHRVRMSLLRGLRGEDLDFRNVYQAKKELVLNSIYGVDINPIAIEIAKLRVWLKMVEEGWEPSFGELPNIDVNIVDGNSLIGLPAKSSGQSNLKAFEVDLDSIQEVREQYKSGEITRRELNKRIDDLKPELRGILADSHHHYFEDTVATADGYDALADSADDLPSIVKTIKAMRGDGSELSDSDKERLDELGFRTYTKSARLENEDIEGTEDDIRELLENGLVLELERRPTDIDLEELAKHEELSYDPFHWAVEFPEAVISKRNGYEVEFDIVVGNPPYGDVLTEVEKKFIEGYNTGSVNDILAQFVEREIQILREGGYLGNILALLFAYQTNAAPLREITRDNLANTRVACFTRRPSQVFEGTQARTGVITGQRKVGGDEKSIQTSRFIRFTEEEREEVFRNVSYESTAGLILGEKIGSGEDYSLPKIGEVEIKSILEKLKDHSDNVFRNKLSRDEAERTEYVVWRSYHPSYFIDPFLMDLYPEGEQSRDFKPMYFNSQLEREAAFLIMQSSLFYLYWMVYENERDLNWKTVEAFPFPAREDLEKNSERIHDLSERLWQEMESRFIGNIRETFDTIGAVKPITDQVDELIGPMFGLTEEEIDFVKGYDEQYRLSDVEQSQLLEVNSD